MKILAFETLLFKLPDNFKGGLSDALRLLAKYNDKTPRMRGGLPIGMKRTKKSWAAFQDTIKRGGRLSCVASIQHWNGKKWVKKRLGA